MKRILSLVIGALLLLAAGRPAHAQWTTQTVTLKPGWNAVYLHVDATHTTLDGTVGADGANPITEIWLWQPVVAQGRFINNPQQPAVVNNDWSLWNRNPALTGSLQSLMANHAYLVRNGSGATYTWNIVGRPAVPSYSWTAQGVNFIGFPTPPANPPVVDTFFSPVPALASQAEIYYYPGNEAAGASPTTAQLFALFSTPLKRGQAFWIRANNLHNNYFGPVQVIPQNPEGIHFNTDLGQYSVRLRNLTPGTLRVTNSLVTSATPPAGMPAFVGQVPLLLRGAFNPTNSSYAFSDFSVPRVITLAPAGTPGSDAEIVIGLNRAAMTNAPNQAGDLYEGIFRINDSLGYTQIELPVTAVKTSNRGLWVGNATIGEVRHYLKAYQRDGAGQPVVSALTTNGAPFVVTNLDTSWGAVRSPFNLRLIVHSDTNNNTRLLQRVFSGWDPNTNAVLCLREQQLDPQQLDKARRISAAHLPWTAANTPWTFTGTFQTGGSLTNILNLDYNDHASNPFLHTFHPDHDNLNATFSAVRPVGVESYGVRRTMVLTFTPPQPDYTSLTTGGTRMEGTYEENITFLGRAYVLGG
ncbi:MAG: hypothetical protein WCS99_20705, partial [Limisphaerales bacterium]